MHPAYKDSTLVSKAAVASRLIVTSSSYVSKTLQTQADNFTRKTKPNAKPLTFQPTTHARIRKVHTFSAGAAGLSAKTVGQVTKYAQNIGASLAKRSQGTSKGVGPDGKPVEGYKPGLLNKSMMAFSTIADGVDQASRSLLSSTSTAATTVVSHKYGAEAGSISQSIGGGVKNVGLVYIDATGVSRRAVIKSVAKGMVVGRVSGGGDLVIDVDQNDAAAAVVAAPPSATEKPPNWKEREAAEGRYTDDASAASGGTPAYSPGVVGYGRAAPPPSYSPGVGESLEGQRAPRDVKR